MPTHSVILYPSRMNAELQTDVLPACRPSHQVVVSSVSTPQLFYLQRYEKINEYVHQLWLVHFVNDQATIVFT